MGKITLRQLVFEDARFGGGIREGAQPCVR